MIPISKIGPGQMIDVKQSSGKKYYTEYYRLCEVIKGRETFDDRHDRSPHRMAKLFGGSWQEYNYHFIVQSAGCPLKCPYCYVDNLKANQYLSAQDLVEDFVQFREAVRKYQQINIRVFHFMGGAPGMHSEYWPQIRDMLDKQGQQDVILFSDVIFIEDRQSGNQPWQYLTLKRFLLTGCLKGVNTQNFYDNTGYDLFNSALEELTHYVNANNFYLTLIKNDNDISRIKNMINPTKIDILRVVNYEVTKRRKCSDDYQ